MADENTYVQPLQSSNPAMQAIEQNLARASQGPVPNLFAPPRPGYVSSFAHRPVNPPGGIGENITEELQGLEEAAGALGGWLNLWERQHFIGDKPLNFLADMANAVQSAPRGMPPAWVIGQKLAEHQAGAIMGNPAWGQHPISERFVDMANLADLSNEAFRADFIEPMKRPGYLGYLADTFQKAPVSTTMAALPLMSGVMKGGSGIQKAAALKAGPQRNMINRLPAPIAEPINKRIENLGGTLKYMTGRAIPTPIATSGLLPPWLAKMNPQGAKMTALNEDILAKDAAFRRDLTAAHHIINDKLAGLSETEIDQLVAGGEYTDPRVRKILAKSPEAQDALDLIRDYNRKFQGTFGINEDDPAHIVRLFGPMTLARMNRAREARLKSLAQEYKTASPERRSAIASEIQGPKFVNEKGENLLVAKGGSKKANAVSRLEKLRKDIELLDAQIAVTKQNMSIWRRGMNKLSKSDAELALQPQKDDLEALQFKRDIARSDYQAAITKQRPLNMPLAMEDLYQGPLLEQTKKLARRMRAKGIKDPVYFAIQSEQDIAKSMNKMNTMLIGGASGKTASLATRQARGELASAMEADAEDLPGYLKQAKKAQIGKIRQVMTPFDKAMLSADKQALRRLEMMAKRQKLSPKDYAELEALAPEDMKHAAGAQGFAKELAKIYKQRILDRQNKPLMTTVSHMIQGHPKSKAIGARSMRPGELVAERVGQMLRYKYLSELARNIIEAQETFTGQKAPTGWGTINMGDMLRSSLKGSGVPEYLINRVSGGADAELILPSNMITVIKEVFGASQEDNFFTKMNRLYTKGLFQYDPTFHPRLIKQTLTLQLANINNPKEFLALLAAHIVVRQKPEIAKLALPAELIMSHEGYNSPELLASGLRAEAAAEAYSKVGYAIHNEQRRAEALVNLWMRAQREPLSVQQLIVKMKNAEAALLEAKSMTFNEEILTQLRQQLKELLGDYSREAYAKTRGIQQIYPLWAWVRHFYQILLSYPKNHPIRVGLMADLQAVLPYLQDPSMDWLNKERGFISLRDEQGQLQRDDKGYPMIFKGPSLLPAEEAVKTLDSLNELLKAPRTGSFRGEVPFPSALNPLIESVTEYETGVNMRTNRPFAEENPDLGYEKFRGEKPHRYDKLTKKVVDKEVPIYRGIENQFPKQWHLLQDILGAAEMIAPVYGQMFSGEPYTGKLPAKIPMASTHTGPGFPSPRQSAGGAIMRDLNEVVLKYLGGFDARPDVPHKR